MDSTFGNSSSPSALDKKLDQIMNDARSDLDAASLPAGMSDPVTAYRKAFDEIQWQSPPADYGGSDFMRPYRAMTGQPETFQGMAGIDYGQPGAIGGAAGAFVESRLCDSCGRVMMAHAVVGSKLCGVCCALPKPGDVIPAEKCSKCGKIAPLHVRTFGSQKARNICAECFYMPAPDPTPGEEKMRPCLAEPSKPVIEKLHAARVAAADRSAEREIARLEGRGFRFHHLATKPLRWSWIGYSWLARVAPVAGAAWWLWTTRS